MPLFRSAFSVREIYWENAPNAGIYSSVLPELLLLKGHFPEKDVKFTCRKLLTSMPSLPLIEFVSFMYRNLLSAWLICWPFCCWPTACSTTRASKAAAASWEVVDWVTYKGTLGLFPIMERFTPPFQNLCLTSVPMATTARKTFWSSNSLLRNSRRFCTSSSSPSSSKLDVVANTEKLT